MSLPWQLWKAQLHNARNERRISMRIKIRNYRQIRFVLILKKLLARAAKLLLTGLADYLSETAPRRERARPF